MRLTRESESDESKAKQETLKERTGEKELNWALFFLPHLLLTLSLTPYIVDMVTVQSAQLKATVTESRMRWLRGRERENWRKIMLIYDDNGEGRTQGTVK